jgi:hypothetical protein
MRGPLLDHVRSSSPAGTAYEFVTGQRLASGDFEGGKEGAVALPAAPATAIIQMTEGVAPP